VPRFVLDGIVARFNRRFSDDGSGSAVFIETSSPGLRGPSGGPLIDVEGRLCGVQSHTAHVDLGFDAQYTTDDGLVTVRQFLNVGAASHVDEVRSMLEAAEVEYRVG
jgi:S1-C subfamily serine protease